MHIHNGGKHVRDSGVKLFRSIFFRFLLIFPRRQREWATRAAVVAVVHWSDRYVQQTLRFVIRRYFSSHCTSTLRSNEAYELRHRSRICFKYISKNEQSIFHRNSFFSFSSLLSLMLVKQSLPRVTKRIH